MRLFEALLILVNGLSLLLLFKKQSKVTWSAIAGVNLFVFFIHTVVEGVRYQMAFSYLFVALFGVYALAKTNDRFFAGKIPIVLKIVMSIVGLVFMGLTVFLAFALPVFTLPTPTGTHHVGITYVHLIDESRPDPFVEIPAHNREVMVKIYYPAIQDDTKPFDSYFHNTPALIRLLTMHFGLPDFMFDHLTLVKTHSKEGLHLSDEQPHYPVILFSHGAGTTMEVQTSQSEDLASHGYIVVAIDHTYASVGTVFPDRIVSAREATTDFNSADPAELITQIMADDAAFVIDELYEMNQGSSVSMFQGKFDLAKIGIIGHSVGGAVAYNLAINDSRVKAAMNLDGAVYITAHEGPERVAPFLMLASESYVQTLQEGVPLMQTFKAMSEEDQAIMHSIYGSEAAYQAAYDKAQQNVIGLAEVLKASGDLFTLKGSDHMKFIDLGLFIGLRPLRELISIRGEMEPVRCLEITEAVTAAFFDRHLKGEGLDSLDSLVQTYPDLINVELE